MPEETAIRTFAKINLLLRILRPRDDGYHEILTLLHPVRLGDEIRMRKEGKDFELVPETPAAALGEDNTLARAWRLLRREHPEQVCGCRARLWKSIPARAGLGGGSANGAGALLALNRLFELELPPERLAALALEIGADTPFFLGNGPAIGRGRGEQLAALSSALRGGVALALSPRGVSTAEAYARFAPGSTEPGEAAAREMAAAVSAGDLAGVAARLHNTFERLIFPARPDLHDTKRRLLNAGAMGAMMTGSGSTVFGLGFQATDAPRLQASMPRERGTTILTEFHSAAYEWLA